MDFLIFLTTYFVMPISMIMARKAAHIAVDAMRCIKGKS